MSTPWPLSAPVTALPLEFGAGVRRLAGLGFTHVDVVALVDRPADHLDALADSGVVVACAALGRGLPEGHTLGAPDVATRRATLRLLERQADDAARLGATCAYLLYLPAGADETAATCFTEGCDLLASHAAGRMVRLAVEPVPGRADARADSLGGWVARVANPNLGLLLDVSHCLLIGEDPAAAVRHAGALLFHVRVGGKGDGLHRPLLQSVIQALRGIGYRGGWSLVGGPDGDDPAGALRQGRELLAGLSGGV